MVLAAKDGCRERGGEDDGETVEVSRALGAALFPSSKSVVRGRRGLRRGEAGSEATRIGGGIPELGILLPEAENTSSCLQYRHQGLLAPIAPEPLNTRRSRR